MKYAHKYDGQIVGRSNSGHKLLTMSQKVENEIFNRTEVFQEVPCSIVISDESEG